LPVKKATEILALDFCYNSGRNYVPNPLAHQAELQVWALSMIMNISDITQALLGNVSLPL
jgi:primary-amine oxidase